MLIWRLLACCICNFMTILYAHTHIYIILIIFTLALDLLNHPNKMCCKIENFIFFVCRDRGWTICRMILILKLYLLIYIYNGHVKFEDSVCIDYGVIVWIIVRTCSVWSLLTFSSVPDLRKLRDFRKGDWNNVHVKIYVKNDENIFIGCGDKVWNT